MMKFNQYASILGVSILGLSFSGFASDTLSTQLTDDGLTFKTNDNMSANVSGYFQAEINRLFGDTANLQSGTALPSTWLQVAGNISSDWAYNVSYDFSATALRNAYIKYEGLKNSALLFGNYAPALGLNNAPDNSKYLNFTTAPLPVLAFAPAFATGVLAYTHTDNMTFLADVFYPTYNTQITEHAPLGASGRITFSPVHTETKVFHAGVSHAYQQIDSSNNLQFTVAPEVNGNFTGNLLNTGTMNNVTSYNTSNIALATVQGPLSIQGEYFTTQVVRNNGQTNLRFNSFYVMASYFLTGESLNYNFEDGAFYNIKEIKHSNTGAWEVATRVSQLNLNDGNVQGGKETNVTVGLNWYYKNHLKWMVGYTRILSNPNNLGVKQNLNAISTQVQVYF